MSAEKKYEDRIKEWQDKAAEVLLIRWDKQADEEDYFVAGCEHVWNTHAVILQEKAKYWELQYAELGKTAADHLEYANKKRLQNEQLESENKSLREEIERLKVTQVKYLDK